MLARFRKHEHNLTDRRVHTKEVEGRKIYIFLQFFLLLGLQGLPDFFLRKPNKLFHEFDSFVRLVRL